ncbi:MAG: HvfC/BufC N-terminal domain-containing protein [Parachlamydiaceae bacterium]
MTQTFDTTAPGKLKNTQLWFASIITQKIDENSRLPLHSPSGVLLEEEARDYIKPSPTLTPARRIELYGQQYWWRLLNILHETYPLVTRLFGYYEFNYTLGIPYLHAYPPNTWSLNALGDHFVEWIRAEYHNNDKKLVQSAAELDLGHHNCFITKRLKALRAEDLPNPTDFSSLLTRPLYLHPCMQLFQFDFDLLSYRLEFLKEEPEYWMEHDFPVLDHTKTNLVIFRNTHNHIAWNTISEAEIKLLACFGKGSTINDACDWLEQQETAIFEEAEEHLHVWLQSWIIKQWLTLERPD